MSERSTTESPASGKTVRELRARAHGLKPVVWISDQVASESVLREIDRSLNAHELIKIHAAVDGRADREALLRAICEALAASPVQVIGKMLVVYRPKRDDDPPPAVAPKSAPSRQPAKGKATQARRSNSGGTDAASKRRRASRPR